MIKYKQVYCDYFNYKVAEDVICEVCDDGTPAVDIHHLDGRGKNKDIPANLMALSRDEHFKIHNGGSKYTKSELIAIHREFMLKNGFKKSDLDNLLEGNKF